MSSAIDQIYIVGNLDDFIDLCVDENASAMEITFRTMAAKGKPLIISENDYGVAAIPVVADYLGRIENGMLRHRHKMSEAVQYLRIVSDKEEIFTPIYDSKRYIDLESERMVTGAFRSWHRRALDKGFPQRYTLRQFSYFYPNPRILVHRQSFEVQTPLISHP